MKNFSVTEKLVCLAAIFVLTACSESADMAQEDPAEIVEIESAAEAEPSAIDLMVERLPGWSRDYKVL
ncbi:MAG: hypothetical protein RLN82_03690, partial [Pseudomonadales bacterium]